MPNVYQTIHDVPRDPNLRTVNRDEWNFSTETEEIWTYTPAFAIEVLPGVVLRAWKTTGPWDTEIHPLDGTRYPDRESAIKAAYEAGIIAQYLPDPEASQALSQAPSGPDPEEGRPY